MPDTSVYTLSLYVPLVPLKPPPCHRSPERVSQSRWVHVWVPQEKLLRAPSASSTHSIPTGFCSQKLWGLIFLALESWAGSLVYVLDSSLLRYPSWIFMHAGVGPAHFASAPLLSVWMDVVSSIPLLSDFHSTRFLTFFSNGCSIF